MAVRPWVSAGKNPGPRACLFSPGLHLVLAGLEVLGTAGLLAIGPLMAWMGLLFGSGLVVPWLRPFPTIEPATAETLHEPWHWETLLALTFVLWVSVEMGMQSLLLPVKVVSDGPIYHLYFAVRWWKAGRLFLVASSVRGECRDLFSSQRRRLVHMADGGVGRRPSRQGRAGTVPLARGDRGVSHRADARRKPELGPPGRLLVRHLGPLLAFSFEANVDTLFVAFYLIAVYFFLVDFQETSGTSALLLGGLAAGIAMGTKPVGVVFVPPLLAVILIVKAARSHSIKKTLAAASLIIFCLLLTSGFWYGRNFLLTGNPLYPLHVELFGKTILSGWYGRDAMRFSILLPADYRVAGAIDMLVALADPRLAPFWIAALAGAWAIGGRRTPRQDRLTWALAALAVLNVALFWICIPYRTQQRFMLQALGLAAGAAGPPARSLARASPGSGRPARTPPADPSDLAGETRGDEDPLGLEPASFPMRSAPHCPCSHCMGRALRTGPDLAAIAGIMLILGMGCCAGLAVWAGSRSNLVNCAAG